MHDLKTLETGQCFRRRWAHARCWFWPWPWLNNRAHWDPPSPAKKNTTANIRSCLFINYHCFTWQWGQICPEMQVNEMHARYDKDHSVPNPIKSPKCLPTASISSRICSSIAVNDVAFTESHEDLSPKASSWDSFASYDDLRWRWQREHIRC